MLKTRIAAGTLASALTLAFLPAGALAAGNSLSVTGKKHVKSGHKTTIKVSGRASKRLGLAIYLDSKACARAIVAEQVRGSSKQLVVKGVKGRFHDNVTFLRSTPGTHYICAYLYHKKGSSFATNAHKGFKYRTS